MGEEKSGFEASWDPGQDNSLVSNEHHMIMHGAHSVCVGNEWFVVTTGPGWRREVQSGMVHLGSEGTKIKTSYGGNRTESEFKCVTFCV